MAGLYHIIIYISVTNNFRKSPSFIDSRHFHGLWFYLILIWMNLRCENCELRQLILWIVLTKYALAFGVFVAGPCIRGMGKDLARNHFSIQEAIGRNIVSKSISFCGVQRCDHPSWTSPHRVDRQRWWFYRLTGSKWWSTERCVSWGWNCCDWSWCYLVDQSSGRLFNVDIFLGRCLKPAGEPVLFHIVIHFGGSIDDTLFSLVTLPIRNACKRINNRHNVRKGGEWNQFTLFANNIHGMGLPFGNCTFESKSCFHLMTASNVALRVTSNTMNAPTASL